MQETLPQRSDDGHTPVLVVHGLWDSVARIAPLVSGLRERGIATVTSFDLRPNDGSAPIEELARQVAEQVEMLRAQATCERIDLVGFSMGALAARYYVQRLGGRAAARRFISISGPHAGTCMAYGMPLPGIRQMRPRSALLRELAADAEPWGAVDVHCIYTPFDLTIMPPSSAILRGARTVARLPVAVHRFMMRDKRVLDHVAQLLRAPDP